MTVIAQLLSVQSNYSGKCNTSNSCKIYSRNICSVYTISLFIFCEFLRILSTTVEFDHLYILTFFSTILYQSRWPSGLRRRLVTERSRVRSLVRPSHHSTNFCNSKQKSKTLRAIFSPCACLKMLDFHRI